LQIGTDSDPSKKAVHESYTEYLTLTNSLCISYRQYPLHFIDLWHSLW